MLDRLRRLSPLILTTVIVPTAIALVYFGLLAEDRYISESRFVIRAPSETAASPLSAVLRQSGFGGGTGIEGNDTISEYVSSRSSLDEANADGFVRQAFSDPELFFLDRFGGISGSSDEQLYGYYLENVILSEAVTSQVLNLRVRAFDPETARALNTRILEQSEKLVNSLSERARADSLQLAQEEVDNATERARLAGLELAAYRQDQGIVDPAEQASAGLQMIGKLQDELIATRTQLRQLETYTPEASQIPFLRTQIRGLQQEIRETEQSLAGGTQSLSTAMVRYQELQLTSQFAEQRVAIALASLQEAQAEARRKRAYIERISDPSLPDYAEEPRRIRSIFATFILGLIVWGVLSMLMIGVKEHRD